MASRAFFKISNLCRPLDAGDEESVRSENNLEKGKSFSWYCLQILRQIDDWKLSVPIPAGQNQFSKGLSSFRLIHQTGAQRKRISIVENEIKTLHCVML